MISDVVLKTLIASEGHIVTQLHRNCANQRNCFELFGFDIMLDKKGKVRNADYKIQFVIVNNNTYVQKGWF